MKRVNGTGSVYKLSGRRRNPYAVSVSTRDADGFLIRKIIGYYPTKKEAQSALDEYNVSPYNILTSRCTFAQIFEMYINEYQYHGTTGTIKAYKSAFNVSSPLHDLIFVDIHHRDLQTFLDHCGKNTPTLESMKKVYNNMWKFAIKNEICNRNAAEGLMIPVRAENPNKRPHIPYSDDEISILWNHSDNDLAAFQLILIYCGCRISELIELDLNDVDLISQTFLIRQSKTKSGIRTVPIADKVLPLWNRLADPSRPGILVGSTGEAIKYQQIMSLWQSFNKPLCIDHLPHDCRHTCITKMTACGIDSRIIKKIVGHKSMDVTEDVYTHTDIQMMLNAVNSI